MDSFDPTTSNFRYNPTENSSRFSGILEIFVHNARNIHNICIYENQDVYAKFSLTYNPDDTFSTRIVNGGGKNPEFNEKLAIEITQSDAVLKCEMWMLSRAKSFMEDQLLGFALVPVSLVFGKGLTRDFSLSSTDLFHSPAGTVKLSLLLKTTNLPFDRGIGSIPGSSITSEVVLLDPVEYSRVEFPDINVVRENQQMVSEYLSGRSSAHEPESGFIGPGSFLCLGSSGSGHDADDYEMVVNSCSISPISPNESLQNSGFFSSTMTSLSDDRNSADSLDKATNVKSSGFKANALNETKDSPSPGNLNRENLIRLPVYPFTLNETKEVKEEAEMQQQIVDMYMRSMQQFTESLEKMRLPMNREKVETGGNREGVIQRPKNDREIENKKKDGGRVFYGSRAFF